MLHGKKDSIVPFDMGKESAQLLKKQGYYNLELISYSQTKHFGILSRSSWEVANFLNRILKERQIKPNKEKKKPEIKIIKIGTKHRLSVSVGNVVSIP